MSNDSNNNKPFYSRDWFKFVTVPILGVLVWCAIMLCVGMWKKAHYAQGIILDEAIPTTVSMKAIASGAGENEAWILTAPQTNRTEMNSATESMVKYAQKEAHERKLRIISIAELSGYLTGGAGRGLICVVEPITAIAPSK
jgi:hypothetical protein